MASIKLPLSPLDLQKYLSIAVGYDIGFDLLYDIYMNANNRADITNKLSNDNFEKLYDAVSKGYNLKATSTNKSINILFAECSEIASDDYKCIELAFVDMSKHIAITLTKFGTTVFLDSKVIKEL